MNNLISLLIEHEGKEKSAYQDSLGYWTIGIGRLIDKRKNAGLSDNEMIFLLNNDIASATDELRGQDWFNNLDKVRQEVFIELVFNMGLEHLLEFNKTLSYVKQRLWGKAAEEIALSLWARQVGVIRVRSIQKRLVTGCYD